VSKRYDDDESIPVKVGQEEIEIEIIALQSDGIAVNSQLVLCHVNETRTESL
jgi:hypothetical protein